MYCTDPTCRAGKQLDKLSGFAYLSGVDAAQTVLALLNLTNTQPGKIGFYDYLNPDYGKVAPLVAAVEASFAGFAAEMDALLAGRSGSVPAHVAHWLQVRTIIAAPLFPMRK